MAIEMVTAPDGRQWTVAATRPRHSTSEWQLVISSPGGLPRHREWLPADADPSDRVTDVARLLEKGGWPE